MKTMKFTTAALALLAAALFTTSAHAANGNLSANGDLVLGVYDASTGGNTYSLEVNLGTLNNLGSSALITQVPADVSAVFTSGQLSSDNIEFGIAATGGIGAYGGLQAGQLLVSTSTTTTIANTADTSSESSAIGAYAKSGSSSSLVAVTPSTPDLAYKIVDTASNSFAYNVAGNYGFASAAPGVLTAYSTGTVVDLYELLGTAQGGTGVPTLEGTFTIESNGLQWNAAQIATVPEPSTYALMLGGLGLLWVLRRRMVA